MKNIEKEKCETALECNRKKKEYKTIECQFQSCWNRKLLATLNEKYFYFEAMRIECETVILFIYFLSFFFFSGFIVWFFFLTVAIFYSW